MKTDESFLSTLWATENPFRFRLPEDKLIKQLFVNIGCGISGRAVAYDDGIPRFESSHREIIYC